MTLIRFRSSLSIATVTSVAILCVALLVLQRNIEKEADAWQWVVHTREVLENLQATVTLTREAEASQRGFLLTKEESYLSVHRRAVSELFESVSDLKQLTSDNPVQQQALQVYEDLAEQRIQKLEDVREMDLDLKRIDASLLEPGKRLQQELLGQASRIRAEEERLLSERKQTVERARSELLAAVATVVAVSIVLIILLWFISERDAARIRVSQENLAEANRYLELRIEERTRQIAEANEELRAFAHTVAHDLRAPLRNVEGFATALLEDESERMSEDGKMFAGRIANAVVRMDRLITDLLAYSRLSRAELRLDDVPLERIVQTVLRDLETVISQSGAQIAVDGTLPFAKASEGVLVQVVSNLVSNGIKFVAPGTRPHIRISGATEHGRAILVVQDNGIGISPEHREQIFGVFERLHGQEQYPGTGIGLAIVKKGIERMGGSVSVSSAPSGGTVFELRLPAST